MCGSAGGVSRNCAASRLFAAPVPGAFDHGKDGSPHSRGTEGVWERESSNAQTPRSPRSTRLADLSSFRHDRSNPIWWFPIVSVENFKSAKLLFLNRVSPGRLSSALLLPAIFKHPTRPI